MKGWRTQMEVMEKRMEDKIGSEIESEGGGEGGGRKDDILIKREGEE